MMILFNITAYARVRIHTVNGGDDNSLLIFLIICAVGSLVIGIASIYMGNEIPGWIINIFLSSVISIILNLIISALV